MQKNTQLERNWLQSLEIGDDNSPKDMYGNILSRVYFRVSTWLPHVCVCHAYLAAGLPCFEVLNVSLDVTFKTYH